MARAAKDASVQHVIWSTFEDTRAYVPLDDTRMPTLQGTYKVPHFDAKAEANREFTDLGVPTTFLLTSFYWENLISFGMGPKRGPDGVLAITMPMGDKKLPGMASADIGKFAYGLFKAGREFIGQTVGVAGEHPTGAQMAASLTKALGPAGALQHGAARCVPRFRIPGRRRPRQHVPVQRRVRAGLLRSPRPDAGSTVEPGRSNLRPVAGGEQGPHTDRLIGHGAFREAPLTWEIAAESRLLNLEHENPTDRFLAATARVCGLTLVTADQRLLRAHPLTP